MFEVGERVVCIDDRPDWMLDHSTGEKTLYDCPLVRGRLYVVREVFPPGYRGFSPVLDRGFRTTDLLIGVGAVRFDGTDMHAAHRFRKINGLDVSEGLAALKALCVPADKPASADRAATREVN